MIEHYAPRNGRILLDNDSIINIADLSKSVYDDDCIVTESEEFRQLRLGNSFAVWHVWSNVADGGIITEQSAVNAPNKSYILKATNVSGAEQLRIGLVINWREILTEV